MKQFWKILKFELGNYFRNKVFMGITIFIVVALGIVMFFPRITAAIKQDGEDTAEKLPVMLVVGGSDEETGLLAEAFAASFPDYEVQTTTRDLEEIQTKIVEGEAECAFVVDGLVSYTYFVSNLSMYDMNTAVADEVLQSVYRMSAMIQGGLSAEEAQGILSLQITHETTNLGKDQAQNFFYTYVMIFALYMVILLYGQMVATNVATEKSSRAMELLITSAKPTAMMFGKVIASCLAGFFQILSIFGSAILFYQLNKNYWTGVTMIASLFNMPVDLLIYMLIFFVLGFFTYAFMFGAVGSTASKLEDINTSVMPITLLFVAGFMVVMMSLANGSVDTTLMRVCSYIPFTSPMAMFTRIAMSVVPWYEILISILLLAGSVVGVGFLSAKIYRMGVLTYGNPLKIKDIFKLLKKK